MWEFLTTVVNNISALLALPFVIAFGIVETIFALPFVILAFVLDDKNNAGFDPEFINRMSLKLNEFETNHGKKLEVDENKLTNVVMFMQKLQKMNESNEKPSKSEIKEFKHEVKVLNDEIKAQFTKSEYKAFKKELKHEVKMFSQSGGLFHRHVKPQQKSVAPVVQPCI